MNDVFNDRERNSFLSDRDARVVGRRSHNLDFTRFSKAAPQPHIQAKNALQVIRRGKQCLPIAV